MIKVLKELQSSTPLHRDHTKLHASDMGAILTEEKIGNVRYGASIYNIITVICDSRHRGIQPAEKTNVLADNGNEQEIVIKRYAEKLCGITIQDAPPINIDNIVIGQPDGITEYNGEKVIFEAKRVANLPNISYEAGADEYWFTERLTQDTVRLHDKEDFFDKLTEVPMSFIPLRYLVQVALYAHGHGVNKVIFGVQWLAEIYGGQYRHFCLLLNIDKTFIDIVMERARYYEQMIARDELPQPMTAEDVKHAYTIISSDKIAYIEDFNYNEKLLVAQCIAVQSRRTEFKATVETEYNTLLKRLQQVLIDKGMSQIHDKSGKKIYSGSKTKTINGKYTIDFIDDYPVL